MAPSTIYLHIGAPKTGTTYLQDMLWANKDVLERAGVLVPGHYPYARVPAVRDVLDVGSEFVRATSPTVAAHRRRDEAVGRADRRCCRKSSCAA